MDPIVIDANIVFAAFIKDGATREIILERGRDLRSPPWLWAEVAARFEWLQEKTGLTPAALEELLRQIRERIVDIPEAAIGRHKEQALSMTEKSGRKDAPYIAAVLAVEGTLWTHDRMLITEVGVPTIRTEELIE